MGGDVRSLGKPDTAIYQPVLERLGLPPERILAVGDALHTDIAGAQGVGISTCWVLSGIHGSKLRCDGGEFDTVRAEAEARNAGLAPLSTLPHFTW
jgi:ribonucleotide monophosphatase NagD (HAD superfamily)